MRYLCCRFATSGALFGFPPTNHRGQKRNRPLTRDILRYREELCCTGLLRPFLTLFHLFQEFHNSLPRLFRQFQRNFRMKTITAHSCLCLAGLARFCKITFLKSWQVLLQLLQLLMFQGSFSGFCTSVPHCQCLAHSFLFSSHLAHGFASASSSFARICAPPLHAVG